MVYLSVLLALVAFLGGGLTFEAQKSVPGDILYPYKVSFNEQFLETILQDPTAKAQFDISVINEIVTQGQTLALAGQLTSLAQTEVTDTITARVQDLTSILQHMQARGESAAAASAAAAAHDALASQAAALADASAQGPISQQIALAPILVRLRTTGATVALLSTKLQAEASGLVPTIRSATITASAVSGL